MMKLAYPGLLNVSLHNHTCFSDGAPTLEELCRAGKKNGFSVFGVSDHWVDTPVKSWSLHYEMEEDRLDSYVETLLALKRELDDDSFTLKLGLEIDYFFENMDDTLRKLEKYPLDYLIGSAHFSGSFPVDDSVSYWENLSREETDRICSVYWDKLEGAAASGNFLFLGHLDLPKKFGFIENEKYYLRAQKVLDLCAKTGTGIELNTAGWYKPCKEQYPALAILQEANARKIPVVVSSDAHDVAHLRRGWTEAENLLRLAGYPFRYEV